MPLLTAALVTDRFNFIKILPLHNKVCTVILSLFDSAKITDFLQFILELATDEAEKLMGKTGPRYFISCNCPIENVSLKENRCVG